MRDLSIKIKVSALLGVALIVVFGLTLANNLRTQSNSIDHLYAQSSSDFSAALTQSVEFMMRKGANEELQPAMESMVAQGLAREISIIDGLKKIARSSVRTDLERRSTDPMWDRIFESLRDTTIEASEAGEPMLVSYRIFKNQSACAECHDGKVIGGMKIVKSEKEVRQILTAGTRNNIIIAVGSIVLSIFGILFVLNSNIFAPLQRVQKAIGQAAQGDVNQDLQSDSRNEIGQLLKSIQELMLYIREFAAHAQAVAKGNLTADIVVRGEHDVLGNAFKQMITNLTEIIRQLTENTRELASVSSEIAATSEQSSKAASSQASQINQIATAIEQMTATIVESSKNAGDATDNARKASDTAANGGEIVSNTIGGMQRISEVVRNSSDAIGKLSDSVHQIGAIIEVIDDIADQTNLLALNAAIEAARAGEQGRGFAVVADEVRKLAERTGKATGEITSMIKGIQVQTGEAVDVMQSGLKEVDTGRQLADRAGDSLTQVVQMSQRVMDMIQQIATASEEQSSAAEQISRTVEQISSVTKETAAGAEQSSAAAEQLNRQAEGLRQMIGKFEIRGGNIAMFSLAKDDHRNYMKRLKAVILGKTSIDTWNSVTHKDCRFGKWYYTDGTSHYTQYGEFWNIEKPHQSVHTAANAAVSALAKGDEKLALKHFEDAERASESVISTCDSAIEALNRTLHV